LFKVDQYSTVINVDISETRHQCLYDIAACICAYFYNRFRPRRASGKI